MRRVVFLLGLTVSAAISAEAVASGKEGDAAERSIVSRMAQIRLPEILFKPPMTLLDAVAFFRKAFHEAGGAGSQEDSGFDIKIVPGVVDGSVVLPLMSARDISYVGALKLVCSTFNCRHVVKGRTVYILGKDQDLGELEPLTPREVPRSKLPEDVAALYNEFVGQCLPMGLCDTGRFVFGRIVEEDGGAAPLKNIVTRCLIRPDGRFFGYDSGGASSDRIEFFKSGYACCAPEVPEAKRALRRDVAVDVGTVTIRKLKKREGVTVRFSARLPRGFAQGRYSLKVLGRQGLDPERRVFGPDIRSPLGSDFEGTFGNGKRIRIPNCTPCCYELTLTGGGLYTVIRTLDLRNRKEGDVGKVRLFPIKKADFDVRFTIDVGQGWTPHSLLLMQDGTRLSFGDRYCIYVSSAQHVADGVRPLDGFVPWLSKPGCFIDDFGRLTPSRYDRLSKAGKLPKPRKMTDPVKDVMVPGRLYRFRVEHTRETLKNDGIHTEGLDEEMIAGLINEKRLEYLVYFRSYERPE